MNFMQSMRDRWHHADTLVCVGLDPEPAKFPATFANDPDAVFHFCRDIVDATADHVCAFKPQIAHFAALAAESSLHRLIAHIHAAHPGIPVILDSKRGDIGSTAQHYASEAFDRYAADAVTVNPYLGRDSVQPFLDRADKGVVILCRTSNSGAGDLQDLIIDGKPLYQRVAEKIAREWNGHGNCALVVGATWPDQLREVRAIVGDMPFLVPGIGAQGGDVEAVVSNAKTDDGTGLIVSSSRAILYASQGEDYAEAAAAAARALRDEINRYRLAAMRATARCTAGRAAIRASQAVSAGKSARSTSA
jgi:orotidine-5'-phosphate decarboxylase